MDIHKTTIDEILQATNELSRDDAALFVSGLTIASLCFLKEVRGLEYCENLAQDALDGKLGHIKTYRRQ